ncbi:PTS system IIB component, Glc family /PTS system IIC component, Glc family [Marininema mesophilum]|uniref:PTS system IIB component, Glc family /PTS system IIC component, Glc family n=1 Tax=Marininema mesophilum TaxID=1048340 RepID=A0A1H3AJC8_9BACL|nr:PTS transporter subunit EIIC [Marininema mesophilum]SDX29723.1 PTS system IIB component, Glc family /PTS system IIC component, Glc family [Marininema mesophilum]
MEKEQELSRSILELLGGQENLTSLSHCMTRLRVTTRDPQKIRLAELKELPDVMGVVQSAGQYQIILGPGKVTKVAQHMARETGIKADEVQDVKASIQDQNRTPFKLFLRRLASIFIPLIPAIVASGMLLGLTNVFLHTDLFGLTPESQTVVLLTAISKVVFTYLAIFVGINTAREFGGTPALGGIAGGLIIFPDIGKITLFGEALVPGRGGLIGVLLAAWFISVAERHIRRYIPAAIDIIVTPTLALLVTGLATYILLQPLGGFIADGITDGLKLLLEAGGTVGAALSGAVLAGTFLPLVITGLHQGLIPIHMELLDKTGLDPLWPILGMAGAGQVGAALAIYLKTKNNTLRNVIKGGLPVGVLGIGEPLIYGVTLPLGRPFLTACLGAAVGGAIQSALGTATIAIGVSGLPAAFLLAKGHLLTFLIGILAAYGAGFLFTWLFGYKRAMDQTFTKENTASTKKTATASSVGSPS